MSAELSLEAAARATAGRVVQSGAARFRGVGIDSRRAQPGEAFVAIPGERCDGHVFWREAVERGAHVLVVERALEGQVPGEVSVLLVQSTRRALGALAREWRRAVGATVVAITGSIGKTTTKELVRSVLAATGATHGNEGNLNNDIGLPLTVLAAPTGTRFLVLEMGMNAPGEIAYLTDIAEPDVGLITCVAPVHLEGLGSLEAIAAAKAELVVGLRPGAWAALPGAEPLLDPWTRGLSPERRVTFGHGTADDVRVAQVDGLGPEGSRIRLVLRGAEIEVRLPIVGAHNARNAAAAAAAGLALGLAPPQIAAGLEAVDPKRLGRRSRLCQVGPYSVLDDCYNANPVAMKAALDALVDLARGASAAAVLGTMLELGEATERYHLEVGAHAATLPLDLLVGVGPWAAALTRSARQAGKQTVEAEDAEQAARALVERVRPGAWVLVKASRGAHLERVIEALARRVEGSVSKGSTDA